tara:strand:- start:280 stop:468 length:189 start_codon:yes stop_codon:yes gene_type:complete
MPSLQQPYERPMTMKQAGYLIIADISGYTQFIKIHNMRKAPIFGEKMAQNGKATQNISLLSF